MTKPLEAAHLRNLEALRDLTSPYTPEQQRKYRKRFCAALRSGKYKQAKFTRKHGEKTMILGKPYACALMVGHYEGLWGCFSRYDQLHPAYDEARQKLGTRLHISSYNDEGFSYREIADLIEKEHP